jgi:chemotaxis protein MotA
VAIFRTANVKTAGDKETPAFKAATARRQNRAAAGRAMMTYPALAGLICGIGILAVAIGLEGSPGSFVNVPSILIVFGGTVCAVIVSFSLGDVADSIRLAKDALSRPGRDVSEAAVRLLHLADIARQRGVLALQAVLVDLVDDAFLHKGLILAIDGHSSAEVESIMMHDLNAVAERQAIGVAVLRRAAEYAPAMGLIGTLIGLVQMLSHLDDPAAIGPSMAVALLTTFYGAVLANLVLAPLAAKLERHGADDMLLNRIFVMGAVSISRQENPRRLEILFNSVLPPSRRVQYFD